jgi:hypothetical protein
VAFQIAAWKENAKIRLHQGTFRRMRARFAALPGYLIWPVFKMGGSAYISQHIQTVPAMRQCGQAGTQSMTRQTT